MAGLSGNTSNNQQTCWDAYVKNNPNYSTTDYEVREIAYIFSDKSPRTMADVVTVVNPGDLVKITATNTTPVNPVKPTKETIRPIVNPKNTSKNLPTTTQICAPVRFNNQTGYLKLTAINKPVFGRAGRRADVGEQTILSMTQGQLETLKWIAGLRGKGTDTKKTNGITITVPGLQVRGGNEIYNVDKIDKVSARGPGGREVKADFAFSNTKGKEVLYISHKLGSSAKDFQQYSGTSKTTGTFEDQEIILNHPEVQGFYSDLWTFYDDVASGLNQYTNNPFMVQNNEVRLKTSGCYVYANDPQLIAMAVYGPEFGPGKPYGPDNVHILGQGNFVWTPITTSEGDITWQLTFSGHMVVSPNLVPFTTGKTDYRACIYGRYDGSRKVPASEGIIPKIRPMICPYPLAASNAGINLDDVYKQNPAAPSAR
tara:strand:- start:1185 stop:2465 length:1281 start_codon:yes stop_codon:yes gene_type:complete